jgi:hypothetical protein
LATKEKPTMNSEYEFIVATPTSAIFILGGELENVMGHFYIIASRCPEIPYPMPTDKVKRI